MDFQKAQKTPSKDILYIILKIPYRFEAIGLELNIANSQSVLSKIIKIVA